MKRHFITYTLLSAALLLSLQACSSSSGAPENTSAPSEELVKSVNVDVQTLEAQVFTSYIRVIGTIESTEDILVAAEAGGRLTNLMVEKGQRIRKNQTIAKTDDAQLLREQKRLQAATEQAKTTYERLERLYIEKQIGSEIDYLNAKYAFEQSEAALQAIEEQLKKTLVKAPFSGTIEDILVESGENTAPGTPIVRLIADDGVKITAGIPSRYADVVQVGDEAEIWFDTDQPDTLKSVITFVGNSIDSFSRTFEIEIAMPAESPVTKIDMMTNIRLKSYQKEDQILVSNEFIYDKDGKKVVYVAKEDGNGNSVAEERTIKTGLSYNSVSIVENGLSLQEDLITLGSAFLKDQSRIKIVSRNGEQLITFQGNNNGEISEQ